MDSALAPHVPLGGHDKGPRQTELVMIIDDSGLQRRILSASLKRSGFEVVEAASGEAAVALCEERLPDVVLCDWVMPGMSGTQLKGGQCRRFDAWADSSNTTTST